MSGIYIPGMDMPTSCRDCPIGDSLCCGLMPGVPALWKEYTNAIRTNRRHKDCPLIPVQEHGRLGDLDLLTKVLKAKATNPLNKETTPYSWAFAYECLADAIGDIPTIIPASTADKEGKA